jgi:hypothetical protein
MVCTAQERITGAVRLDEFPDMIADDTQAHLDILAGHLGQDSSLQAFIVAYRPEDWTYGSYLRTVHGYVEYLVAKRGVLSERIKVIEAGMKPKLEIELWLARTGSAPPVAPVPQNLAPSLPLQFDRLWLGPGCEGEFTLVLEDPHVVAHFFAGALRETPTAKGLLLLHPAGSTGDANKLLSKLKEELINQENVPAERFVALTVSPRTCAQLDAWLVPSEMTTTNNQDPAVFLQSAVMTKAEKEQYMVRRVEFVGNNYTRDRTLRRRIPQLEEGELFTRDALMRSLAALSQLQVIKPIAMKDVDVQLNSGEKTIDLVLFFTERYRRN